MPKLDGYEICAKLKSNPHTKDIPVIFITAKSDEDSIEKAYEVGGIDYVTKPFKPKELLAKVKREFYLQGLQRELKLLASTDSMTKLYNRIYFTKLSEDALDLAKRENKELSILMIDIDSFKNINDTHGRQIGDEAIVALAERLIECRQTSDIVCRYGGEEFVILLPNRSTDDAKKVAEDMRKNIENFAMKLPSGEDLKFTISVGVSSVDFANDKNIESALSRADNALYRAKNNGRNRVKCCNQKGEEAE